jgi:hypothetical protein
MSKPKLTRQLEMFADQSPERPAVAARPGQAGNRLLRGARRCPVPWPLRRLASIASCA